MSSTRNYRKGRFYRPELETPWQRLSGNLGFRILAGVLLVAGVTAAVTLALLRYA